jgi:hypothetical protein
MLAVLRNALLLSFAIHGSSAKGEGGIDADLQALSGHVKDCADAFFAPIYKEVFQRPADQTNRFEREAGYYTNPDPVEYRSGYVYYGLTYYQVVDGADTSQLSLYFDTDGRVRGQIYGKAGEFIASFDSDDGLSFPQVTYKTHVTSYRIDRFGRMVDVVEELDSVTVLPAGELADRLTFHNSQTTFPVDFSLGGLRQYKACLEGS